jgi:hypothetical protein
MQRPKLSKHVSRLGSERFESPFAIVQKSVIAYYAVDNAAPDWSAAWAKWDAKGVGEIRVDSFVETLKSITTATDENNEQKQLVSDKDLFDMFAELDEDRSAMMGFQEFTRWISRSPQSHNLHLLATRLNRYIAGDSYAKFFESFDRDRSGALSLEEFRTGVRQVGKVTTAQLTNDEIDFLFKTVCDMTIDDKSEQISLADFGHWIKTECETSPEQLVPKFAPIVFFTLIIFSFLKIYL